MFSKKNIVITIGDYGSIIAVYDGNQVKNKSYLEELDEKSQSDIKNIFTSNKDFSVYILIDTIDQTYKKKIYPPMHKGDLARLVKRDMSLDGDNESFKNSIIIDQKKPKGKKSSTQNNKKWECIFVSVSKSKTITKWIEFLLSMPNRLVGIYMLPIETFSLLSLLKSDIKLQSKSKNAKNNDLYCLVMHNKASGTRQIVFSDQAIVFTRVVSYTFSQPDFLEKYEQDIYSTFEYLKRLFPDASISEFEVVNILPTEAIEHIKKINTTDLSITNYTPLEAATKTGEAKLLSQSSSSCDLLLSKTFVKKNKILKFTTPKIALLEKFFTVLQATNCLGYLLVAVTIVVIISGMISRGKIKDVVKLSETKKSATLEELKEIQKTALEDTQLDENGEAIAVDSIMDFGKMEETFKPLNSSMSDTYTELKFLKDFNVKLTNFSYSTNSFNQKRPSTRQSYKIAFKGDILNQSGDIEDLFRDFDSLVTEVKKNYNDKQVKYSELPRNIDFNKKYYDFPVEFRISK